MFVRPCWKPQSEDEIYDFVDQNPWGLLVNNAEHGPYATNLPLLLDRSRKGKGVLVGHIARANAHAAVLGSGSAPALAVFQGPYSYVTASWYPKRDMPPTYYYTAVHCYGSLRLQDEHELHRWVEILTERMESQLEDGWKTSEIEESAITRRLKAILGFEIEIERLEGKFKLGQDEPELDALAIAEHLASRNEGTDRDLGERICKYSGQRPKSGN
jgi:transcriptional regulator